MFLFLFHGLVQGQFEFTPRQCTERPTVQIQREGEPESTDGTFFNQWKLSERGRGCQ